LHLDPVEESHVKTHPADAGARTALHQLLLVCGVLSSLLYVGTDIAAAMRWDGYSYAGQFISELMSIEAPTRPFVVRLFFAYGVLATAFGVGVVMSAGTDRKLRAAGWLVVAYALVGYMGLLLFPMHLRGTFRSMMATDVMHVVMTSVIVLLTFSFIGFGASAGGRAFRRYSIGTIVLLLVCGVLIGLETPRMKALLPTPWLGLEERLTAYASMLWLLVLAVVLLRRGPAWERLLRWRSA
jgi:uncharacterized protein DUF998